MLVDKETQHEQIMTALDLREFAVVKRRLESMQPADVVDLMADVSPKDRAIIFRLLPKDLAIEVFEELPPEDQRLLLDSFGDEHVSEIVNEMSPDDRAELFDEMPAAVTARLMRLTSPSERKATARLLGYREGTAGRIMTPEYVSLRSDMTAQEALRTIREVGLSKETVYYSYITDRSRVLIGVVSLKDLVLADPSTPVSELMHWDVIAAHTDQDQEEVAELLARYNLLAVPVVDSEGRLVGIVTADDAADIIEEEATEDIQRLGGMEAIEIAYERAGVFFLWRKRIVWLLFLLVADFLSSSVIAAYESLLHATVALAFFIPMLIDSGGNTGTQAATLLVRGLGTGGVSTKDWLRVLWKETRVGILIGACLGAVVYARSFVWIGGPQIGLVVALTMVALVLWANLLGTGLPLLLYRLKLDPAVISSPLITTLADVTGLLIYFQIARWVLGI